MPLIGPKPILGVLETASPMEIVMASGRTNTRWHEIQGRRYSPGSLLFKGLCKGGHGPHMIQLVAVRFTVERDGETTEIHARCDVVDNLIERATWDDPLATRQA